MPSVPLKVILLAPSPYLGLSGPSLLVSVPVFLFEKLSEDTDIVRVSAQLLDQHSSLFIHWSAFVFALLSFLPIVKALHGHFMHHRSGGILLDDERAPLAGSN